MAKPILSLVVGVVWFAGFAAGCGQSAPVELAEERAPLPPSTLPVGGPPALYAAEAAVPSPRGWPFPEAFPRTSGSGRLHGGASYWSDFLYDDHGALGAAVAAPPIIFSPPFGTYVYPAGAPAHQNGADIAGTAVGLRGDSAWFRVDWQTLDDSNFPAAIWAFDTDDDAATGAAEWPAGAGVMSPGIERWLLVSGRGAWLVDSQGDRIPLAAAGGELLIDVNVRSFVARVPRAAIGGGERWRVRLGAAMANASGEGLAAVPIERGSLPAQPALYDVAFRAHEQEPLGRDNWWRDKQMALSLAAGELSPFSLQVDWGELAALAESPEPQPTGWINRWYLSSIELGPGIAPNGRYYASDFLPNFMGRRQPYGVYVPRSLAAGAAAPLTILLHSINLGHNQFINWNPAFIEQLCEARKSICIAPLGRGADGWWANEAELDMWEVWNRVAADYLLDPTRTVLAGYSMGGYGAYRIGLEHPDLFAAVLVLAGAPACSVRIVEGVEGSAVSGNRECDAESNTSPLVENAREVPFYLGHDALDELAPVTSAVEQAGRFDELGYRHRIEIYANQDHVGWSNTGTFEGAAHWLGAKDRRVASNPGRITYAWYAQHQREDLGIGPGTVAWVSGLRAASDEPGFRGRIDIVSHALAASEPVIERINEPVANTDGVAAATELRWIGFSSPSLRQSVLQLDLQGVTALTLDLPRAGIAQGERAAVRVTSDYAAEVSLVGLRPGAGARTDRGQATQADNAGRLTVVVAIGETSITVGE